MEPACGDRLQACRRQRGLQYTHGAQLPAPPCATTLPHTGLGAPSPVHPPPACLPACRAQLALTLIEPKSGRGLDILSTTPAMVLYTASSFDLKGKGGVQYPRYGAVALEMVTLLCWAVHVALHSLCACTCCGAAACVHESSPELAGTPV